ncbi:hypothetical protein E3N88_08037 [Mikania micrantha]|uniref:Retrovirus-related Pol polyprotein from transposon TNT 1-94-like beta-barrel domain-containing protein n=1 Tax=Mikania micrantha TaxID=192012 RepID=A0A5N6PFP9_9ASTR|nr:hypothetical protein E3N88_08037 [Mikania micrantha]
MTGNKSLHSTLDTSVGGKVRFGNNSSMVIEGKGSMLLECKNGEQQLLTDIPYIPYLKNNIFRIGQAEKGGCEITIKQGALTMTELDGILLMKTQRTPSRLYKINLKVGLAICLLTNLNDAAWLWHAHLGHQRTEQNERGFEICVDLTNNTTGMQKNGPAEAGDPHSPSTGSPTRFSDSSLDANETNQTPAPSVFSSPESSVKGRGPMLSRLPTDIINPLDPHLAEQETCNDTPTKGFTFDTGSSGVLCQFHSAGMTHFFPYSPRQASNDTLDDRVKRCALSAIYCSGLADDPLAYF